MPREAETEITPPAPDVTATAPAAPAAPAESAADPVRTAPDTQQTRAVAPAAALAPAIAAPGVSEAEMQAAIERAQAEERLRIATIHDAARKLGVPQSVADDLVSRGAGLDAARAALIDAAAARDAAQETRPHVRTGGLDAGETRRAAVETALLHRYDPAASP